MVQDGQEAPKQPSDEELRQFAQEKSPEELQRLEDEKAKLEAQYEERQLEVSEKAECLQEKIKRREQELVEIYIEIERLKEDLEAKQVSTVAKIFNVLEVRSLRKEIGAQAMKANDLRREFDGLWMLYEDLQKEARSRVEIDEAERMVTEFYADQAQALEMHEKDKQAREVGNACRRNNALITHSFMEYSESSNTTQFTVVQKGVTWKEKLKILLALEPQISTASVRLDSSSGENQDGAREPDRPYFPLGVLLKGGEVGLSSPGDMFTTPVGGKREAGFSHEDSFGESANDLDRAINNRLPHRQNEIAVSQPKVAALFVDSDFSGVSDDYDIKRNSDLKKELLSTARTYGLPLFQRDVESGKFFKVQDIVKKMVRVDFDEVEREVIVCDEEPASVEQILNSDFELDEQAKEKMTEEILAGDYFKLNSTERAHFDSFVSAKGIVELYKKMKSGNMEDYGDKNQADQLKRGYLSIKNPQVNFDCGRDLSTIEAYLGAIKDVVIPFFEKTIADWQERKEKEGDPAKRQHWELVLAKDLKTLQELHWYLWGVSDAAKSIGDTECAEKAGSLASTKVSKEEKDSFLNKRIGGKGEFKMTKDDLKSVTASQYHS